MKLGLAIREVGDAERTLAQQLNALGERHKTDHDVFHLTETLQRIAHDNLERLAPHGSGLLEKAREKSAELIGRRPEPGLLLVRERTLHLLYAEASINYVILGQGAQAARDRDLLDAVSLCHAQTLRGMKWTVTRIKTAAPQVLTS
ncbi:MAG: hypothetical protein ACJ76K_00700 [Solirubrobacteraceae bacterium]